jgi:histidinol phosphatase-like enzyme
MATQETVVFNCNVVISNQEGDGELPNDEYIESIMQEGLTAFLAAQGLQLVDISVVFRTGELDL